MEGEERDRLIYSLARQGGQLASALLSEEQRLVGQQLVDHGLAKWLPDTGGLALSWICPVCGPSLLVSEGTRALFCVRHGDQEDIDADPDLEDWHSGKRDPSILTD